MREDRGGFEELDLLVLAQHEFGGFAPLRSVFPAVLDEAGWMAVDLRNLTVSYALPLTAV